MTDGRKESSLEETEGKQPDLPALLPEKYPQRDLFICDVQDAILKDVMAQMEHPFYSLSKKPETRIRRYEHNGNWIEITPSVKGLATIYDKDILIYCISQVMHKLKNHEPVSKRVHINARELLQFCNRGTAGKDYNALCQAIDRLRGTVISTNIRVDGETERFDAFGLIDSGTVERKFGLDGRLQSVRVTLSDWVFGAIEANAVLTLHRDYFRLRKPLERRLYELARKHCGSQAEWEVGIKLLFKKSGSRAAEKEFRRILREIAVSDHLPDYMLKLDHERDIVIFRSRGTVEASRVKQQSAGQGRYGRAALKGDTYEKARAEAPGWDVYALEQEWRDWITEAPRDPDRAFLGFCRKWYERRGPA